MYQYRANVEFDIDGLKDFYIDDLMEQELNIYLMVFRMLDLRLY